MGVPATTGRLCKTLAEMEIGDYIRCTYTADTANTAGEFSDLGGFADTYTAVETVTDEEGNQTQVEVEKTYEELPVTPGNTANGFFYFLKAGKGLLIADRGLVNSICWEVLNARGYVLGTPFANGYLRMLSHAEFMNYIANSNLNGNITIRDNNVWNRATVSDIPVYFRSGYYLWGIYPELAQDKRRSENFIEGRSDGTAYDSEHHSYSYYMEWFLNKWYGSSSAFDTRYHNQVASIYAYFTFRPAFEYIDNPKSQTIWY